ncbi:unnamed protein product, partial [Pylaiella littoralis]
EWLKKNGCNWNTGGSTPMTHTIMSRGTLYVQEDLYDEFLGVYGGEIKRGNVTLAYSEKRSSDVFRMYFDLDILDKSVLSEAKVLEIVKQVQRTTSMFFVDFPDDVFKCVVSRTKTKEVKVYETFTKNGIHLNFPKLLVKMKIALQIRLSVVNKLDKVFGPRKIGKNPWSDVIDKAPYNNGLKMTGSVKTEQCKKCDSSKRNKSRKSESTSPKFVILREIAMIRKRHYKRDDESFDYSNVMTTEGDEYRNVELSRLHTEYHVITQICLSCNNKGWFLEDRSYSPSHVLGKDGIICDDDLSYIQTGFHEQMRWTTIRARPI